MQKLCQVLAIEKQTKDSSESQLTEIYQTLQKEPLLNGISRVYTPLAEDGEKFPDESNQVQVRVEEALKRVVNLMTPLYDLMATRDKSNQGAVADVVVDEQVILKNVPAITLLALEKRLQDLHTIICKLPELPQTATWKYDQNQSCYATDPVETAKSKKIPKPFVKYEATQQHPAQVEVVHEDILQGYWKSIKYSGALPLDRKRGLRERCEKLMAAVKFAREKANQADAPKVSLGKEVFDFLFAE